MPLLSFESRFVGPIQSGDKQQTIRGYRKDGRDPKPGDRLHLWTGPYRPGERVKVGEAVCTAVRPVRIWHEGFVCGVDLDGKKLPLRNIHRIAQADGFADAAALFDYFERNGGFPFEGLVIAWDEIEAPHPPKGGE